MPLRAPVFALLLLSLAVVSCAQRRPPQNTSVLVSALDLAAPGEARRAFSRGTQALSDGRLGEAGLELERAITLYPRFPAAHNNLGIVYMRQRKLERSRRELRRAIELDKRHVNAYLNLAQTLILEGRMAEARPLLEKCVAIDPGHAEAFTLLAKTQLHEGELDEVIESARRAHQLGHQTGYAHFLAGVALQQQRRPQEAAGEFRLYLEETPNGANARLARQQLRRMQETP